MNLTQWFSLALVVAITIGGAMVGFGRVMAQHADPSSITICASTGMGDDIGPTQVTREEYDAYIAVAGFAPLQPNAAGQCSFSIYFTPIAADPSTPSRTIVETAPIVLPRTGVGTAQRCC